jgi:hypothetical protein
MIKEVTHLALEKENFPWLNNFEPIKLARLNYDQSSMLYIGSVVGRCKKLEELAGQLSEYESSTANRMFLIASRTVIESPGSLRKFDSVNAKGGIIPFWDRSGNVRVFLGRLNNIDNIPVIVKLAATKKSYEPDVLQILTGINRRTAEEKCR